MPDRLPVRRLAFALARLSMIAFHVLPDELHATDHSTASLPVIELHQHGPRRPHNRGLP
jgi:hypothetical protein